MKSIHTLLLALLCTGLSTQAQVYISGKISSPKSNIIQFTAEFQEDTEQPFTTQVDKSGHFRITIPLEKASYFELQHYNEVTTLFLEPGDSLNIQMSTKKFDENLKYSGRGAANNNYLAAEFLEFGDYDNGKQPYFLQIQTLPSKYELMEAKSVALAAMRKEIELLNKYKNELSPSFYKYRSLEIDYTWKNVLMGMPTFKAYYAEQKGESFLTSSIPKAYYDFIDTTQLENLDALNIGHYHDYIEDVIYLKAEENMALNDNSTVYFQNVVSTVERLIQPGVTRSKFLLGIIDDLGYELEPLLFQSHLNTIMTSNDLNLAKSATILHERYSRLAKGNILPPLHAYDNQGQKVELASMHGKVIYLDLWASWCVPCIQEFPKSKKLQETYAQNNDVIFVYISLDNNKKKWTKAVKKYQLTGYQLHLNGFKHELPRYFSVNGIPRYILIGKKGEIIHASAPRPGSDKIRELINQALEAK